MNRATDYADQMICCAQPVRSEPSTLHCAFCRLAWDAADLAPPGCRAARYDDEPVADGAQPYVRPGNFD